MFIRTYTVHKLYFHILSVSHDSAQYKKQETRKNVSYEKIIEINKEDGFGRKGLSNENRKKPIVGLGLLPDANQIPIGMKLFPRNQSEKPVIRNVIDNLKKRNSVSGMTIRIADKGLNCTENIFHALKNGTCQKTDI